MSGEFFLAQFFSGASNLFVAAPSPYERRFADLAETVGSRIAKDRPEPKSGECRQRRVTIVEKRIRPKLPRSQRRCDFLPPLQGRYSREMLPGRSFPGDAERFC